MHTAKYIVFWVLVLSGLLHALQNLVHVLYHIKHIYKYPKCLLWNVLQHYKSFLFMKMYLTVQSLLQQMQTISKAQKNSQFEQVSQETNILMGVTSQLYRLKYTSTIYINTTVKPSMSSYIMAKLITSHNMEINVSQLNNKIGHRNDNIQHLLHFSRTLWQYKPNASFVARVTKLQNVDLNNSINMEDFYQIIYQMCIKVHPKLVFSCCC